MTSKILKSTFIFSLFVLLAQVIGLLRDIYLLRHFGAGNILDTYYLAFKIPDFLNVFYSVFLGSVIFIPLLTKAKHEEGENGVQKTVNKIGSLVLCLVLLFTFLLYVAMPYLTPLLAPTWTYSDLEMLTSISRTLLFAQLFFPIGILAGSLGMVYEKPFGMASGGAFYNLCILFGAVVLSPFLGINGVVYGVILGSIVFMLVQIFPKSLRHFIFKFKFEFDFADWVFFFKRNFGRFVSVLLNQTFWLAILSLASVAGKGGVTLFSNSFNIFLAIYFVLGASLATALMPENSRLHISGSHEDLKNSLHNSLVYIFVFSLVVSIFSIFFSKLILETVYYFSNLSEVELKTMWQVFAILSLSTPLLNVIEVIRKYMYTTDMILQSTGVMLSLLPTMFFFNYIFNHFTNISVLNSLALSIFVANLFSLFVILYLLKRNDRIEINYILKNTYKAFLVFLLSLISYGYYLSFNFSFSENILISTFEQVCILGTIYLFFSYLLNDKIFKSIFSHTLKILRITT
jgi:putative peptidoglycan lipid II flippase